MIAALVARWPRRNVIVVEVPAAPVAIPTTAEAPAAARPRARVDPVAFLAVMSLLALAVCGCRNVQKEEPVSGPVVQAYAPGGLAVAEIHLGKAVGAEKRVDDIASSFAPRDTIYASVVTQGAARSAALTARWTYKDSRVLEETTQLIAPAGTAVTEFHIAKPGGFDAGPYAVEIFVNGAPAGGRAFQVE